MWSEATAHHLFALCANEATETIQLATSVYIEYDDENLHDELRSFLGSHHHIDPQRAWYDVIFTVREYVILFTDWWDSLVTGVAAPTDNVALPPAMLQLQALLLASQPWIQHALYDIGTRAPTMRLVFPMRSGFLSCAFPKTFCDYSSMVNGGLLARKSGNWKTLLAFTIMMSLPLLQSYCFVFFGESK